MGSDTRPKRSHKGDSGKRAARSCTKPTPLHNLAFFIRPRVPWVPSHDTTRHDRPDPFARAPTHDTSRPARTKFGVSMGARPERNFGVSVGARPERRHEGASGKRATRTCRRHTGGHDLAFLARPRVPGHPHTARHGPTGLVRADPTRPNAFARAPTHDTTRPDPNKIWGFLVCTTRTKFGVSMGARPERRHKAASGKRAARTCRRHTGGHDLAFLALPRVPEHPRTARPDPPERRHDGASGKRVARTCRRHTGGHALTFFARPHVPEHPRTARHDPTPLDSPERVCTGTHL
jgi:hypothetical protein